MMMPPQQGYPAPPVFPGNAPIAFNNPQNQMAPPQQAPASQQRPLFRGSMQDEAPPPPPPPPAPVRLTAPSPEQLGIGSTPAGANDIDWGAVHRRLDQLGATCFHVERLAGGAKVTCLLPTAQAGHNRHVEAQANSQAEAVRLVLDKAEQWALGK
jgi:hypothetical protein